LRPQLTELNQQLEQVKKDPRQYNQLVGPYNETLAQAKQRRKLMDDAAGKLEKARDSRDEWRESVVGALHKAQDATAKYAALGGDAKIKSAIDRYNATAAQKVALGPSGQFKQDLDALRKIVTDMAAEGVPAQMGSGTPVVRVTINGKTVPMIWDSGASDVALSAETAEALGIHPPANAPTITAAIADGSTVEAKIVIVPSISVGVFTATNVQCSVSPKVNRHVDDLLGGTFQQHFVCRVDHSAGIIHLTPRDASASIGGLADAAPAAPASPVPAAGTTPLPAAVPAAVDGPFAAWKLNVAGGLLLLPDEAAMRPATLKVHGLRTKLESEMNARAGVNRAIDAATAEFERLWGRLDDLESQIKKAKDPAAHDALIAPYNETLRGEQQQRAKVLDLQKRLGGIEDSQTDFRNALLAAVKVAGPAQKQYEALAKDPKLAAAIAAHNAKNTPVKVGPSEEFAADYDFLSQCVDQFVAEVVPARMDNGTPVVAVTINGKKVAMIWDSGATYVSLSAETAEELGIHPTDKDPTVEMVIANGSTVRSKMVILPTVTVGVFTAKNVECIIDPKGKQRSPDLLGGAFQRHFLCRVDERAGVIHLTPGDSSASVSKPAPDARSTPAVGN
jgi:clan AA aspartic protease (TIGR02281 family)